MWYLSGLWILIPLCKFLSSTTQIIDQFLASYVVFLCINFVSISVNIIVSHFVVTIALHWSCRIVNDCWRCVGASYDNFVDDLKEAESLRQCRYGIYDAQYTLKDGQNRNKIVFFLWYAAAYLCYYPMYIFMALNKTEKCVFFGKTSTHWNCDF